MKRQLIILFIFTFFLSATGLPVALHYCGMQGSVSLSSCDMCEVEETENESSCCQAEDKFSIQLKSGNSEECCETKVVDSSIKDDFVKAISEPKIDSKHLESSLISSDDNSLSFSAQNYLHFSDSSPPLSSNKIYLINSIFRI